FALAVTLPPRAVAGGLSLDHITPTEDGLGRRPVAFKYALSKLGADSPKIEAAYQVNVENGWSLGIAGGLNVTGETSGGEFLARMRLAL
ncbi:MAG TPA: hypothetical protein VFU87_03535, partial [Sphingomicrobium sp.]|nr:hypothetical protein [Sphingomicrobium sp.]